MTVLVGGIPGASSRLSGGLAAVAPVMVSDVVPMSIAQQLSLSGPRVGYFRRTVGDVTTDSTGAALGSCNVHLMRSADDVKLGDVVSDAGGNYAFSVYVDGPFYCKAEKAGAPNVAGVTDNTLMGV